MARGGPGHTTPVGEAALDTYAAEESGGLCALAGHSPRWVKIFSMTSAWSMEASAEERIWKAVGRVPQEG